jgi:metallo-beta-lactamase class B
MGAKMKSNGLFWAIALVMTSFLQAGEHPKSYRTWFEATSPFQIAGPIYYVGTRGLGVYLIKTSEGLILLNGAMPASKKLISESIHKLGFKMKDIRLILVSHSHVDHTGTIADSKKLSGAPVVVMESGVELLKSGGKLDYLFGEKPDMHFEPVTADRVLKDGEMVTLGDVQLKAHWTPGHTRGCTTWETTIQEGGRKYMVLFPDGTSVNPGTRLIKDPSYPGILNDYQKTFKVLESLRPDIFLSYHAEFFDLEKKRVRMKKEGIKAWVDPQGYKQLIKQTKAAFEKKVEEEKNLGAL